MMWRSPPICNTLCCCCWCRSSNVASLATLLSRLRHIIHYSELWHAPHTCRVITNRQLLGSANAFTLVRGCGCNGVRFDSDLTPRVSSMHELFSFLSSFFFFSFACYCYAKIVCGERMHIEQNRTAMLKFKLLYVHSISAVAIFMPAFLFLILLKVCNNLFCVLRPVRHECFASFDNDNL